MKIALYSPYLDTVGGGEKYILTIAETLSTKEEVTILLDNNLYSQDIKVITQKVHDFLGINLTNVKFEKAPLGKGSSFFRRALFLRKFDILIYLTDGSIFFSTAKKSFIHFQVPFQNQESLWQRVKLSSWKKAIYNSNFTKNIIEENYSIKGTVIYPPVAIHNFKSTRKKNQIISVGRFFGYDKSKKHLFLIESFKKLIKANDLDWTLYLVGGMGSGDLDYVEELKKSAHPHIKILPNLPLQDLIKLYSESSIYWHAKGYGETDPTMFEHFGITTVEAMASGCVPVVINLGGQREIVMNGDDGFLWDDQDELLSKTLKLIKNKKLLSKMSLNAQEKAKRYNIEKFKENIHKLIYES